MFQTHLYRITFRYSNIEISINDNIIIYKFTANEQELAKELIAKTIKALDFKYVKKILLKTEVKEHNLTNLTELIYVYNGSFSNYHLLFNSSSVMEWSLELKKKKTSFLELSFDPISETPSFIEHPKPPKKPKEINIKNLKFGQIAFLYFNIKNIDPWVEVAKLISSLTPEEVNSLLSKTKKPLYVKNCFSFIAHVYTDKIYLQPTKYSYDTSELENFLNEYEITKVFIDNEVVRGKNWIQKLKASTKKTIIYYKTKQ